MLDATLRNRSRAGRPKDPLTRGNQRRANIPPGTPSLGRQSLLVQIVVAGLIWLVGAFVFFSAQWSSGFDRLMGNTGDSRLITYLNEHWFLVLHGSQAWRNPPFFYPTKGLIGYTDTFFLWQILFGPLRALGADPFLSYQLTIIALCLVAFATFVIFFKLAFRTPIFLASVAGFIVCFSNNLSQHSGSPQLFGIYFVPPLLLGAFGAWRWRNSRPALSGWMSAAVGFFLALLLFSTYYVGWFTLFATLLVSVLSSLFLVRCTLQQMLASILAVWKLVVAACLGFFAGLLPFLVTYLPVVKELGVRHYSDAMYYAAKWNDIINVSKGNYLWGHLFQNLWSGPSPASYEDSSALPPLLLGTVVLGLGVTVVLAFRSGRKFTGAQRLTIALCLSSIFMTILPIDTSHGSAWILIWHLPGANAIRAIDRIEVLNTIVASAAVVALLTQALGWTRRRKLRAGRRVAFALLLVGLCVEQMHDSSASQWTRKAELSATATLHMPPAGCTSFYVTNSRTNSLLFYEYQTEAMIISQHVGLPTLNGYSGDNPPGWGLEFPASPTYLSYVSAWAHAHGLTTGVCNLDLGTKKWTLEPAL